MDGSQFAKLCREHPVLEERVLDVYLMSCGGLTAAEADIAFRQVLALHYVRLQPPMHTVTAPNTYGYSPQCIRLQPACGMMAAEADFRLRSGRL